MIKGQFIHETAQWPNPAWLNAWVERKALRLWRKRRIDEIIGKGGYLIPLFDKEEEPT